MMNKIKLVYHSNSIPKDEYGDLKIVGSFINFGDTPEMAYEERIRNIVKTYYKHRTTYITYEWWWGYHTYSSLVVNIFRLLVVEGTLSPDDIEFYADDTLVKVNEYGACDNNNHKAKWLDVENNVCERILRLASNKRKENRK